MGSGEGDDRSYDRQGYVRRSQLKNGVLAFVVMFIVVVVAALYPPAQMLRSYLPVVAYLVGGVTAGYYFSQDLDRKEIQFQSRDGLILWGVCVVGLIAAAFAAGTPIRVLMDGQSVSQAFRGIASTIFGQVGAGNAGLVLALFGIAVGHDMYHQQFTMLKPLSREKAAQVRELTHSVQPLIEARHRFGRSFTPDQLAGLLPDPNQKASMDMTLSQLMDQGLVRLESGVISVTSKGENLLSISRFVAGTKERGEEGADLCAYCGRPLKLSDKLMRLNYYGKSYLMHYSEREGVRIFGRLPYIDRVLDLHPAEIARPVYEKPKVLPTIDHKVTLVLGIAGALFAMASYSWIMVNARILPIASEVSFFGGTLLSVSLIFALCGVVGGLLTFLDPGGSYGGAMMLALLFFATPFIALTQQVVFGGYYASVGLIAVGGIISVKAHPRMA
jgi:hypothetical protein